MILLPAIATDAGILMGCLVCILVGLFVGLLIGPEMEK